MCAYKAEQSWKRDGGNSVTGDQPCDTLGHLEVCSQKSRQRHNPEAKKQLLMKTAKALQVLKDGLWSTLIGGHHMKGHWKNDAFVFT